MTRAAPTTNLISVYAGRQYLGHLLKLRRFRFEAFDRDDNQVGLFADQRAAAMAVVEAARRVSQ